MYCNTLFGKEDCEKYEEDIDKLRSSEESKEHN